MVRVYLLLGSNLGDRKAQIIRARAEIGKLAGTVVLTSSLYETEPWGNHEQPLFINQVLEIQTSLPPVALLETIQKIENSLGRVRAEKWGPRPIDIDILFYADNIIRESALIIPHPDIENRRFTLVPLCELAPHMKHPTTGKTMAALLQVCSDKLGVRKVSDLVS